MSVSVQATPQAPAPVAPSQPDPPDLLSLPVEVREEIYRYLLPPYRVSRDRSGDTYHARDSIDALGIKIDILRVSNQIKEEVGRCRPLGLLSQASCSHNQPLLSESPRSTITEKGSVWSIHLKFIEKLVLDGDSLSAKRLIETTSSDVLPRLRCVEIVLRHWVRNFQYLSNGAELPTLLEGLGNDRIFQAGYKYELLSGPIPCQTWKAMNFPPMLKAGKELNTRTSPSFELYIRTKMPVQKPPPANRVMRTVEAVIDVAMEQIVSIRRVRNNGNIWDFHGTDVDLRPARQLAKPFDPSWAPSAA